MYLILLDNLQNVGNLEQVKRVLNNNLNATWEGGMCGDFNTGLRVN
jgi:hypothetical protein